MISDAFLFSFILLFEKTQEKHNLFLGAIC